MAIFRRGAVRRSVERVGDGMRLALGGTWMARLAAAVARLLRPRELLVRSDGRVRYVVLTTGHQLAATGIAFLLVGWLAFGSISLLIHDERLDDKNSQIRDAKIAYLDMLAEIGESYDEFTALSDRFAARETMLDDLMRPDGIAPEITAGDAPREIDSIEERLRQSEAEQARVFTGHRALQAKLRRFGADLLALARRNRALNDTVEKLEERLASAADEKNGALEDRRRLAARLRTTEGALARAKEHNTMLESNLLRQEERLAAADRGEVGPGMDSATDPTAALDREVASLKRRLSKSENERTLEDRIHGILAALSGMIGQRDHLQEARSELRERVRALEGRLAALQQSQDEIVQSLAERTLSGVEGVEKTVAMTGLDVEMLLDRAAREQYGTGGPYVPVGPEGDSEVFLASVANLDDAVARWEQLQLILGTLPLTSPVDSYWVSSLFGERKDPMTGERAMHEGVDLSAAPKTPVLATAPGRVVFAGQKGSYGRMIEIDHGLGIRTRYAHLRSIDVEAGDLVDYRDKIGVLGSSGRSTGPHLHYEILVDDEPYDPMKFLKAGRYVFKG